MTGKTKDPRGRKSKKDRSSSGGPSDPTRSKKNFHSGSNDTDNDDDDFSSSGKQKRVVPPTLIKCSLKKCPYCEFESKFPFSVGRHLRMHTEQYNNILNGAERIDGISVRDESSTPRKRGPNKPKTSSGDSSDMSTTPKQRKKRNTKNDDFVVDPTVVHNNSVQQDHPIHPPILTQPPSLPVEPYHHAYQNEHLYPNERQLPELDLYSNAGHEQMISHVQLPQQDEFRASGQYNMNSSVPNWGQWGNLVIMPEGTATPITTELSNNYLDQLPTHNDELSLIPNHMLQQSPNNSYYQKGTMTQMRNMEFDTHSASLPNNVPYDVLTNGMYPPPPLSLTETVSHSSSSTVHGIPGSQAASISPVEAAGKPKRKRKSQNISNKFEKNDSKRRTTSKVKKKKSESESDTKKEATTKLQNLEKRRLIYAQKKKAKQSTSQLETSTSTMVSAAQANLNSSAAEVDVPSNANINVASNSTPSSSSTSTTTTMQLPKTGPDSLEVSNITSNDKGSINEFQMPIQCNEEDFGANTSELRDTNKPETSKRQRKKKIIPDGSVNENEQQRKKGRKPRKLKEKEEMEQILEECWLLLSDEERRQHEESQKKALSTDELPRSVTSSSQLFLDSNLSLPVNGDDSSALSVHSNANGREALVEGNIVQDPKEILVQKPVGPFASAASSPLGIKTANISNVKRDNETVKSKSIKAPKANNKEKATGNKVKRKLLFEKHASKLKETKSNEQKPDISLDLPSTFPPFARCLDLNEKEHSETLQGPPKKKEGRQRKKLMETSSATNDKGTLKKGRKNAKLLHPDTSQISDTSPPILTKEVDEENNQVAKKVELAKPTKDEAAKYSCELCTFSTPHGFSFMIHEKIHKTFDCLPDFFKQLLTVNGNKEKLFAAEPTF